MLKKYTPVEYDNINGPEGWTVNDIYKHDDIYIDVDAMTDRELWRVFAAAVGFKPSLRAIEVLWCDESFIEFIYIAQRLNGFFPLGRLELAYP